MNPESKTRRVDKSIDETEENSVILSGFLTNLQHRPLLPSVWRNRFWVLRSEGALYCYRHASSKNHILRLDLTDPSIRIRTGEPVTELRGVKWPRKVQSDRKLCILLKKKRHFYYTADSTNLSAWDEALHSVADKFAFSSNWTLGSQRGQMGGGEGPALSVQDMRSGDGRGVEPEDKEAILESYRRRKSVMARAQLATLFGAQPSPSLSRVHNYGDSDEMEPLSRRVQRLSDASSTVVTLRRRHAEVEAPVEEHGPFTFQPRAGSPVPEASERQRKTSHSLPKPTQAGLALSKKREEEDEEKHFMKKMERIRQVATQHELPMRTAGDLQRINRMPQRIRIPDQFMRPIDTPPPSPPHHGPRLVASPTDLASIKERMQPAGPGRHSPYIPHRAVHRRPRAAPDPVIPPPHAFQVNRDVSQEVILLQEESLNELRKVLSNYSGQEQTTPQEQEASGERGEGDDDIPPEEYLSKKRPSVASKRMESIQIAEIVDESRPSQGWRRPVPSVPSTSPLAREAPFSFSQDTAAASVDSPDTPPTSAHTAGESADTPTNTAIRLTKSADVHTDATRSLPVMYSPDGTEIVKGEDPSEEAKQDRVQKAVDWVGGEVEKLIKEILSLGRIVPGGQTEIEFGYLFSETANKFDALSGILKTAKKLGVVSYEGEVLFQGVNDNTVVTLLKGDIGDIKKETFIRTPPVSPRASRAGDSPPGKHRKFGTGTQQYGQNQCAVCGKQVYQVEYVGATDKAFHRWCFRCCVCQVTLSPTNFATIADKYYCTVHYERAYMSAGGYRELEGHPSAPT